MSFDLFAMQQLILTRLAPVAGGIPLVDSFTRVDLTDDGAQTTAAQIFFTGFTPEGQAGRSAKHAVVWSFDLYVDTSRASAEQKTAAAAFFTAALAALVGWECQPGHEVRTSAGQDSGWDGRVLRISFGFTLPVYVAG